MSDAPVDWGRVAYGVDVREGVIRVVRAERRGRRILLAPSNLRDARFLQEQSRGCAVVAALGPRESITHWLDVGFGARAKVERVLPTLLDIQIPFPLDECVYVFLGLRRVGPGASRALGVASRLQDARARLVRVESAGIEASLLDHEGLALWTRSIEESPVVAGGEGEARAVLHVCGDRATLVVGLAGEYRSTHSVRLDDAASVRRLLRSVTGERVRRWRWFWAGEGVSAAQRGHLMAELGTELALDVQEHREPELFLARALAWRAVLPGEWSCNLRAGPLEHPVVKRRRSRSGRVVRVVALVGALILCAVNAVATMMLKARADALQREVVTVARAVAGNAVGGARGTHAVDVARRHLDQRRGELEAYERMFTPSLTLATREILETAAQDGLRLSAVTVRAGHASVAGQGPAWDSAQGLAACLERHGYRVKLDRQELPAHQAVAFTLTAEAPHG